MIHLLTIIIAQIYYQIFNKTIKSSKIVFFYVFFHQYTLLYLVFSLSRYQLVSFSITIIKSIFESAGIYHCVLQVICFKFLFPRNRPCQVNRCRSGMHRAHDVDFHACIKTEVLRDSWNFISCKHDTESEEHIFLPRKQSEE